jgi:hypothetical protein
MLKNGKYSIKFKTPIGEDGGFVIMEDGKLVGGDSNYIYDGSYYKKGKATKARILVDNYTGRNTSIFGPAKYVWLKAVYSTTEDGKGFKGKAFVIDVTPDMPGAKGAAVPISGRMLD